MSWLRSTADSGVDHLVDAGDGGHRAAWCRSHAQHRRHALLYQRWRALRPSTPTCSAMDCTHVVVISPFGTDGPAHRRQASSRVCTDSRARTWKARSRPFASRAGRAGRGDPAPDADSSARRGHEPDGSSDPHPRRPSRFRPRQAGSHQRVPGRRRLPAEPRPQGVDLRRPVDCTRWQVILKQPFLDRSRTDSAGSAAGLQHRPRAREDRLPVVGQVANLRTDCQSVPRAEHGPDAFSSHRIPRYFLRGRRWVRLCTFLRLPAPPPR